MDCLRNQARKNLPENGMGDGFYWESNGDCNNNNNNLIRLVPGTNESGRGKNGLFRDSLLWKATSKMASSWPSQRKWVAFLFLDLVKKKKKQ